MGLMLQGIITTSMLTDEEEVSEGEVVCLEELFAAAEKEGFLVKEKENMIAGDRQASSTSISVGDVGQDINMIAEAIAEDIMDTLRETNIMQQELAYSGDCCDPRVEFDEDGEIGAFSSHKQSLDIPPAPHQDPACHQVHSISPVYSIELKLQGSDRNDPDYHPMSEDEDSDSSDLIAVPEPEFSLDVQAIEEQSNIELVVPPRKRMSRGQRKKYDTRGESQAKREKGEGYVGYRRVKKDDQQVIMAHDAPRQAKAMGPPCNSAKCKKWSSRFCSSVSDAERAKLFSLFWKTMNWDSKKMFICGLVDIVQKKSNQTTHAEGGKSRRSLTYIYHLKIGDRKVQVCKKLFLSTFGIGEMSVRHWLNNFHHFSVPHSVHPDDHGQQQCETLSGGGTPKKQKRQPIPKFVEAERYLKGFLDAMPKLPSHYVRKDSRKLYLEADITSVSQLYRLYKRKCAEDKHQFMSRHKFDKTYKSMNIGIFNPRKDQCDVCCGFKNGKISTEVHERHIILKDQARAEKESDKGRAIVGDIHVITVDMMAVQVMPRLLASSSYYKLKIHVHNYTVFNLGNRDVKCYWWDETIGSLDASTYASCLTDYIEELMTSSKKDVIIYSDGCTAQNRNSVLANALLHTSMKHGITITQKILEKGHTQMEVDSVHGHIEGKMGKTEMYLPHHFIQKTEEARIQGGNPYRAVYLEHGFFQDYSGPENMIYSSIRPGNSKGEPVVQDLRWIRYEPHGEIKYKCTYDAELQSLPRRPRLKKEHTFPKLFTSARPLTYDQYMDLLYLAENLLPKDCLLYYKSLAHEGKSIRAERKRVGNIHKKSAEKSGLSKAETEKKEKEKKAKK